MAKPLHHLLAGHGVHPNLPNPVVTPEPSPGQASATDAAARIAGVINALGVEIPAKPGSPTPTDENRIVWYDPEASVVSTFVADLYGYRLNDPDLPHYALVARAFTPAGALATLVLNADDDTGHAQQASVVVSARADSGATLYLKTLLDDQGLSDWLFNVFTSTGDLLYRSGAGTATRLAIGAIDQVLTVATGSVPSWDYPPGYQWDYKQITSNATTTATTAATATTIVAGNAVTYDGTPVLVEFSCPESIRGTTHITYVLYDGATQLGNFGKHDGGALGMPTKLETQTTPSAGSHTYTVKAFVDAGTGTASAGNGAAGNLVPCFVRVTKV
jgi:hypothetical protein